MARAETQTRLDLGQVESGLIDLSLLDGRDPDFVAWMKRARRSKKARQIFRELQLLGIVQDDEDLINFLEGGYVLGDDSESTSLRQADFKNRSQILNGTGRIWRQYFRETASSDEVAETTVSLRLGSIGHSAIVDLYRRNFPQYSWSELQPKIYGQEYNMMPLFDQDPESIFRPLGTDEYSTECGFSGDYLGEIAFRTQFLSDLISNDTGALFSEDFQGEFSQLTARIAPLFSRQLYAAQQATSNRDHFDKYVHTVLTWSRAATEILDQESPVVFSEIPVFSWKRNGIGGGRIDAIEVYGLDGYYLDAQVAEQLRDMTQASYSSVGELLSCICKETKAERPEVRIIDFKMGIGDAQRHQKMIPFEEVAEGPRNRDVSQVGAYLTLAPLDFASFVTDEGEVLTDEIVWGAGDPFYSGEVQYFFPNSPRVSHEIIWDAAKKQEQFEQYRSNLLKARERAQVRSTDLVMGRVIEGALLGEQKKASSGQRIDPRIESFLRGE